MKVKEGEKAEFLLTRKLKELWNMKIMVITIVVRALEKDPQNVEKGHIEMEIRGRLKTI